LLASVHKWIEPCKFLKIDGNVYLTLGIEWDTILLCFIVVALMPVPWVFSYAGQEITHFGEYEIPCLGLFRDLH